MPQAAADYQFLVARAKAENRMSDVIGRRLNLTKKGPEFVGLCPFHHDKKPSLAVNDDKGVYYCRSCGAKGDLITFLMEYENRGFLDVLHDLTGGAVDNREHRRAVARAALPAPEPERLPYEIIQPVPEGAPPLAPERKGFARFEQRRTADIRAPANEERPVTALSVAMLHDYRDHDGRLMGHVVRSEWTGDEGKREKITPPVVWARHDDGTEGWTFAAFPEPRLPYGMERFAGKAVSAVVIGEGEKTADSWDRTMARHGWVALSWAGGSKAIAKTDWSAVVQAVADHNGRDRSVMVVLAPDNDQPGLVAMYDIANELIDAGLPEDALFVIPAPDGACKGWDVSDAEEAGWSADRIAEYAQDSLVGHVDFFAAHDVFDPSGETESAGAPPAHVMGGHAPGGDTGHDAGDDIVDVPFDMVPAGGAGTLSASVDAVMADLADGGPSPAILDALQATQAEDTETYRAVMAGVRRAGGDHRAVKAALLERARAGGRREEIAMARSGLQPEALAWIERIEALGNAALTDETLLADMAAVVRARVDDPEASALATEIDGYLQIARTVDPMAFNQAVGTRLTDDATERGDAGGGAGGAAGGAGGGGQGGFADGPPDGTMPEQFLAAYGAPLRALGFHRGQYYYLSTRTGEIVVLKAEQHRDRQLLQLAPLDAWEAAFPTEKGGADWTKAAAWAMDQCHEAGTFDMEMVRGRGAWVEDANRVVLHLGDRLVVDGLETPLDGHRSRWYYERSKPMPAPIMDDPMGEAEGAELLNIFGNLRWENPLSGLLMAGWVAIAMICGAVHWRPHVWLTGGSGSGKSWVLGQIINPLLRNIALFVQSSSSEAGIRHSLEADARPIIFDEAESEDTRAQTRMQQVLELARQASSESGGEIRKGSASGQAKVYRIRSMFLFASIGVGLRQQADRNRVTVLSLAKPPAPWETEARARERERFAHLTRIVSEFVTEENAARLFARMIRLIPVIRDNTQVMANAAAEVLSSQRLGDQIGVMLAGAYALTNEDRLTYDEAKDWLLLHHYDDHVEDAAEADEETCLRVLTSHQVRVETSQMGTVYRTIGEMMLCGLSGGRTDQFVLGETACQMLARIGIKVDIARNGIVVHNDLPALADIYKDSPWPVGWGRILSRLSGAESRGTTHFSPGIKKGRGTFIPADALFGDEDIPDAGSA